MRFLYDMVNDRKIYPFAKATEAEDITEETTANTDSMMGRDTGASTTTQATTSENDGEIDTNTDNILGEGDTTNETPDNEDANAEGDNPDEEGDADPMSENTPDGDGADDLSNTDDIADSLDDGNQNTFEAFRKKKLHAQFMTLYDTLDTSIRLLAETLPNIQESLAFNTMSNVNNNLTQCKNYVTDILSKEFDETEYAVLMKKYVALNRIYDICIRILEKYFDFKNS